MANKFYFANAGQRQNAFIRFSNQSGFTLVELLVVISIIAMLTVPNTTYHAPTKKSFSLPDIPTIMNWWVLSSLALLFVIGVFAVVGGWTIRPASTVKIEIAAPLAEPQPAIPMETPQPVVARVPIAPEPQPAIPMETSQPVVAVVPVPEVQPEPSIPTSSRYPDIFEAAKNGSVDDIRYFLANGVDVNSKSEPRSWTEVRTINGRDINVRFSSPSATPLQNAISNPRHGLEIVKYLISQGADVNVRDHADTTQPTQMQSVKYSVRLAVN